MEFFLHHLEVSITIYLKKTLSVLLRTTCRNPKKHDIMQNKQNEQDNVVFSKISEKNLITTISLYLVQNI